MKSPRVSNVYEFTLANGSESSGKQMVWLGNSILYHQGKQFNCVPN